MFKAAGAQSMIFTLLGDYYMYHERSSFIWVGHLCYLMDKLGFSQASTASALSRIRKKDWLETKRLKKKSFYRPTPKGFEWIDRGVELVFHSSNKTELKEGENHFLILTYSIPENNRRLRDKLRRELVKMGCGLITNSTWITSSERHTEILLLIDSMLISEYCYLFEARMMGASRSRLEHCWDISYIRNQYLDFIREFYGHLSALRLKKEKDPDYLIDYFVERNRLAHSFRKLPYLEPQLPELATAVADVRQQALDIFDAIFDLVSREARLFYNQLEEKIISPQV